MIRRSVWYAVAGLVACAALGVNMAWALIITIATAVVGAL
jgi:ABC-type spermidine/putrescine transport system permease subunit I